jgi:hypothetical protein
MVSAPIFRRLLRRQVLRRVREGFPAHALVKAL